jgi:hypothetical protein
MSYEPIRWRGLVVPLEPNGDPGAWRLDEDEHYFGVALEEDGTFSACVEVGFIEGEGSGATPLDALDGALRDVRARAQETAAVVDKLLARPR